MVFKSRQFKLREIRSSEIKRQTYNTLASVCNIEDNCLTAL